MIELQYISLHLIVVVLTFVYCRKISRSPFSEYWKLAAIPILCFSLEEGLRWGRLIDWCFYYNAYSEILDRKFGTIEPLFWLIWGAFAKLGLPYYAVITFCSFLLCFSLFFFCKPYKKGIFIAIPLAIVTAGTFASNLIRWYMAVSFMLLGCRLYLDGKQKKAYLLFFCSFCCHYAIIIGLLLLFFVNKIWKKCICSAKVAIVVSATLIFTLNQFPQLITYLATLSALLSGVERFEHYINDSQQWFTISDNLNFIYLFFSMIPLYIMLYGVYLYRKENNQYYFLYNSFVLLLWIKSAGQGLELGLRYKAIFDLFMCAAVGILFINANKKNLQNIIIKSAIVIWLILQTIIFCRPLPDNAYNLYVWNEHKQDPYILSGKYKSWW